MLLKSLNTKPKKIQSVMLFVSFLIYNLATSQITVSENSTFYIGKNTIICTKKDSATTQTSSLHQKIYIKEGTIVTNLNNIVTQEIVFVEKPKIKINSFVSVKQTELNSLDTTKSRVKEKEILKVLKTEIVSTEIKVQEKSKIYPINSTENSSLSSYLYVNKSAISSYNNTVTKKVNGDFLKYSNHFSFSFNIRKDAIAYKDEAFKASYLLTSVFSRPPPISYLTFS